MAFDSERIVRSDEQFLDEFNAYVDLCRCLLPAGKPMYVMAVEMGLCPGTLHRVFAHETRFPRLLTAQKLGEYVGIALVGSRKKPRLKKIRKAG